MSITTEKIATHVTKPTENILAEAIAPVHPELPALHEHAYGNTNR